MEPVFFICDEVRAGLRELPDQCIQAVVTSPPYYGLRAYGLEPSVWSRDPKCEHEWTALEGAGCPRCGAWSGELGHEPTVTLYVEHLVEVFREVKRVLRNDGCFWLNLGDSYTSGGRTRRATDKKLPQREMGYRAPTPPGLKEKDLIGVPWRVAFALQDDGWYLRSDVIWEKGSCLSGGAYVYARTQKGEMPMMVKDLVRLRPETVQLWNGEKWTQVLDFWKNSAPEAPIEIVLRSGERISCTSDHVWPTQRGNLLAGQLRVGDVIQSCLLPEPISPEQPACLPDSIGWFVGLYLAEGSRSNRCIHISGHVKETERFDRLCEIAKAFGGTCCKHNGSGNKQTINLYGDVLIGVLDTYIGGKGAKGKCLTTACWRRSNEFLRQVLLGYLSGDGSYEEETGRWRLGFTRNYSLERDLRVICGRLGYPLRISPSFSTCNGKRFLSFKGDLRFERSGYQTARKDGQIEEIRKSRARQFWDIAVEDEPHLFSLASGVLTHNCMPESVKDRPTRSHEYLFLFTKSPNYYWDKHAVLEPFVDERMGRAGGNAQHYRSGRPDGQTRRPIDAPPTAGRNVRTVWKMNPKPFPGAHFATFPPSLPEKCLRATTSQHGACAECGSPYQRIVEKGEPLEEWRASCGADSSGEYHGTAQKDYATAGAQNASATKARILAGMVAKRTVGWRKTCRCETDEVVPCLCLDPFAGSGTTGMVAKQLGLRAILCDQNEDYIRMARERCGVEEDQCDTF